MLPLPVIAIIDVGKTNKKLLLFDQHYQLVHEQAAKLAETVDEDGYPSEDLAALHLWMLDSLKSVLARKEFDIRALNFSAYGASLVYLDNNGDPLTPLYNYLKPYPGPLQNKFYANYGGEEAVSLRTASPILGNLNSGMQLYRLKYERPQIFQKIKQVLHLPQYLSYLITGKAYSELTSIGCHTHLWDFEKNHYHDWVLQEGLDALLPPLVSCSEVQHIDFAGSYFSAGCGLHDSSAALIPYLLNFSEPFILISSGTWCISLNPFSKLPLTKDELQRDCLCYLQYQGKPVKASRLFAGQEHEDGIKRIAAQFNLNACFYKDIDFDPEMVTTLQNKQQTNGGSFSLSDLSTHVSAREAYHQLMMDIMEKQVSSTRLVLKEGDVKRIFVDGGFSNNRLYMNLLAASFPDIEVFAASMTQATALGAALVMHDTWQQKPPPADLIGLKFAGKLVIR